MREKNEGDDSHPRIAQAHGQQYPWPARRYQLDSSCGRLFSVYPASLASGAKSAFSRNDHCDFDYPVLSWWLSFFVEKKSVTTNILSWNMTGRCVHCAMAAYSVNICDHRSHLPHFLLWLWYDEARKQKLRVFFFSSSLKSYHLFSRGHATLHLAVLVGW